MLSNEKIHQHSKKDFEIKSDQKMIVEITQDEKTTVKGNSTHDTTGIEQAEGADVRRRGRQPRMTVKGVSVNVEASAALTLKGATVNIQGSGPVSIKGMPISIG